MIIMTAVYHKTPAPSSKVSHLIFPMYMQDFKLHWYTVAVHTVATYLGLAEVFCCTMYGGVE